MTESTDDALAQLGHALAEAVLGALRDVAGEDASVKEVATLLDYGALAAHVRPGTVAVDASSVDGAVGRSLLTLDGAAARTLLAGPLPSGETPPPAPGAQPGAPATPPPLAAGELTTLAELTDRLNAAAADALGMLLGQRVRYEDARASMVEDPRFVVRPGPVQAICTTFSLRGHELRLLQFAPNALVLRAAHAFEDPAHDATPGPLPGAGAGPSEQALGTMQLRVWAELGRTDIALSDALELPLGAVVELEQDADAPVDLIVNGMRFGTGRLTVTDDGEWALVLDEISPEAVERVAAG